MQECGSLSCILDIVYMVLKGEVGGAVDLFFLSALTNIIMLDVRFIAVFQMNCHVFLDLNELPCFFSYCLPWVRRLMEDHEAFVSLGEIYEAERHRQVESGHVVLS